MTNCRGRAFFILFAAIIATGPDQTDPAHAAEPSAPSVLKELKSSERSIKTIEARYRTRIAGSEHPAFIDAEWGYDGLREYIRARVGDSHPDGYIMDPLRFAFDGIKFRLFRHDLRSGDLSASIGPLRANTFRSYGSPNVLRGFYLNSGRKTLSDMLESAERLEVAGTHHTADRGRVVVVEAIGVEHPRIDDYGYDFRVTLAADRGFAPVRIEKYVSYGGRHRWKALVRRIDRIELQQVEGVWLPVKGTVTHYKRVWEPREGVTEAELEAAETKVEGRDLQTVKTPLLQRPHHVEVIPDSIRINEPIPHHRFVIVFPKGTRVYNEFLETSYTIGEDADQ